MNHSILLENQNRRKDYSMWRLLCFVMFCVWQMGVIYYVGPALNIDGRTPLPISADNLTLLIVAGYVLSIFTMLLFPKIVILLSRISVTVALFSAIALFFPLGTAVLTLCIYIQCFCCCYMIGFESATMVHYMTQSSVTGHLLIAYPIGYTLIAFIQNDVIALDFSVFRILMIIMLAMLLFFYLNVPVNSCIRFVQKNDGLILPRRFFGGFLLLAFLSALLGVIAPAVAASVKHGVFVSYISCAVSSAAVYFLYKKTGRHPISYISYVIGISAVGYLLMVVSEHLPALGLLACALIGVGMAACALLPLFALLVVKQYPGKFIVPSYIGLAMLAVIVQSILVEVFRASVILLNLTYMIIVIILTLIYVLVEPYLLYSMHRSFEEPVIGETLQMQESALEASAKDSPLSMLTKRELEVVDFISYGYSNRDIAKMLFISEHTVKDHTKNIYRKLNVHSRFELIALVSRIRTTDRTK